MVLQADSVRNLLRQLEDGLPLVDNFPGPILQTLGENVAVVLNLADYDPDSNTGGNGGADSSFSEFGNLVGIEPGTATLTSAGAQTHIYVLDTGGIPAGQVMVYRDMSMFCDASAAEDWTARITGFGIGALSILKYNFRTDAGSDGETQVFAQTPSPGSPGSNSAMLGQGPLIAYPGEVVTLRSSSTLATGVISRLDFIRERYATTLTAVNRSGAIDASAI